MTPPLFGGRGGARAAGPPPIHLGARQTHKGGERTWDCQDAWWAGVDPPRVAVADGATRAFFAREWAWLVAEHFCRGGSGGIAADLLRANESDAWRTSLAGVRAQWRDTVSRIIERSPNRDLLENRLQRKDPAVATLVGVELDPARGTWRATIIGDSCLLRFNRYTRAFLGSAPLDDPEQFDNHPEALISVAGSNRETAPGQQPDGWITADEVLVLATDALAKWLLEFPETGRWQAVTELLNTDDAAFAAKVSAARRGEFPGAPAMEDDDVTLLVVAFGAPLHGTRPLWEVVDALPPLSLEALAPEEPEPAAGTAAGVPAASVATIFDPPPPILSQPEPPEPPAPGDQPRDASEPAPPPPEPASGPGSFEAVSIPIVPGPADAMATRVHVPSPPAAEPLRAAMGAGEIAPPSAAVIEQTLFPAGEERMKSPAGLDATRIQPDTGPELSATGGADGTRVARGGEPPEAEERLAPGQLQGRAGTNGGSHGRMRSLIAAGHADLIGQLTRLPERRLVILMLSGWMLFLATTLGSIVMWPDPDERSAATEPGKQGQTKDSVDPPVVSPVVPAPPVAVLLPAHTEIFRSADESTQPRLVLAEPVTATLPDGLGAGWRRIEFEAWVASRISNGELATRAGDHAPVAVGSRGVNFRPQPGVSGAPLFTTTSPDSFPYVGEERSGSGAPWYRVRISGFVRPR